MNEPHVTVNVRHKVYLAGPIQHSEDNGREWRRNLAARRTEFRWLNPLDKYDVERDDIVLVSRERQVDRNDKSVEYVGIDELVETDKEMIDDASALLVRWDDIPSCGTPMEVMYAYERDYPITVWYEGDDLSPWMEYHSDHVSGSVDDCVNWLDKVLYGR